MMVAAASDAEPIDQRREHDGPVEALLRITETARFLRLSDGRLYAQVPVGGRHEIYALKSAAFRRWLIDGYHRELSEFPPTGPSAVSRCARGHRAVRGRHAVGLHSRRTRRQRQTARTCYLDLADPTGQAVQIGPEGWSVVQNPGVHFRPSRRAPAAPHAQPRGLDRAAPAVRQPHRARFPPPDRLDGRRAPARRTLSHPGPLRRARLGQEHPGQGRPPAGRPPGCARCWPQPRNTRELMASGRQRLAAGLRQYQRHARLAVRRPVHAGHRRVLRASRRSPATSGSVIHAQRPVILNGIDEFVARGDLADRSVFLDLPPIASGRRRCEDRVLEFVPSGLSADPGRPARRRRRRLAATAVGSTRRIAAHGRLRRIRRGGRPRAGLAGRHGSLGLPREPAAGDGDPARRLTIGTPAA